MKRVLIIFSVYTTAALALPWQMNVKPQTESVSAIEFEIAKEPTFAPNTLVDQGYAKNTTLSGNLPGGLYYLRYRAQSTDGKTQPWSAPNELLLTNRSDTQFLEPADNTRLESPTAKTSILYRWKKVDAATQYVVDLRTTDNKQKPLLIKTKNPFITTELGYGTWVAQVQTFVGTKFIASSPPTRITIEPTTQSGVEFVNPQNDDVIQSNKKSYLQIKRAYTATQSTLVIKGLSQSKGRPAVDESIDISPSATEVTLPALAIGRYQVSIIDQLNEKSSIESNIVINAEEDPLGRLSTGTKSEGEFSLGVLAGNRYQSNSAIGLQRAKSDGAASSRTIMLFRSAYFDPYHLEARFELLPSRFVPPATLQTNDNGDKSLEFLTSINMLYRSPWPDSPNPIFLRAGIFAKRFHQFYSGGNTPVLLYGLHTGADWLWKTWSSKWTTRFSLRVMAPVISVAKEVATGSPSLRPSVEFSSTFKRQIGDYVSFLISPEIKAEKWINSEKDSSEQKSEQYFLGYGFQLGFSLEL